MFGRQPNRSATKADGLAALFAAGATLVLITVALPHASDTRDTAVAIPPIVAYVVALVLVVVGGRLGPRAFEAILAFGAVLITGCIVFGGQSASAYPLMYVWVALYAGCFFSPAMILAQVGLCAALYAGVLATRDDIPVPQAHWVMAVGTAAVTGMLVAALVRRLAASAADLAAVAEMAAGAGRGGATGYAADICRHVLASTGGDVAVLLEPDGDEPLSTTGSAGQVRALEGVPALAEALERCVAEGVPVTLSTGGRPSLWRGVVAGLAQPVPRDGHAAGVLLVAWRRPRRRLPERTAASATVFAAQAGVAMERAERLSRERERHALAINDEIVQGLVVAKYALAAGDEAKASRFLAQTHERARDLMSAQLDEVARAGGRIVPGDLARRDRGVSA
jgi:hypothetical protein